MACRVSSKAFLHSVSELICNRWLPAGYPYSSYPTVGKGVGLAMSDRVTVERKEFESFLAENQKLIDRSQALMSTIDRLEKENKQLRDELEVSRARVRALEVNASEMRQSDDALKRARANVARLMEEADKRLAKSE